MNEIRSFVDDNGQKPFDKWFKKLRDQRAEARILVRLDRLANGLEGDAKSVGGEGVKELRIPEGKGYRVYYGWDGDAVVILLCGGDKSSQKRDIDRAKRYWRQYHDH